MSFSGRKQEKVAEKCIMRSLIIHMLHQILLRLIDSRIMVWKGHVAWMGVVRYAYKFGRNICSEKSTSGPMYRWKYNIKIDLIISGKK
jgi:hypothetical protein